MRAVLSVAGEALMGLSCECLFLAILMELNRESTIANARTETLQFSSIHFTSI
jgi:hypothetical protein